MLIFGQCTPPTSSLRIFHLAAVGLVLPFWAASYRKTQSMLTSVCLAMLLPAHEPKILENGEGPRWSTHSKALHSPCSPALRSCFRPPLRRSFVMNPQPARNPGVLLVRQISTNFPVPKSRLLHVHPRKKSAVRLVVWHARAVMFAGSDSSPAGARAGPRWKDCMPGTLNETAQTFLLWYCLLVLRRPDSCGSEARGVCVCYPSGLFAQFTRVASCTKLPFLKKTQNVKDGTPQRRGSVG